MCRFLNAWYCAIDEQTGRGRVMIWKSVRDGVGVKLDLGGTLFEN